MKPVLVSIAESRHLSPSLAGTVLECLTTDVVDCSSWDDVASLRDRWLEGEVILLDKLDCSKVELINVKQAGPSRCFALLFFAEEKSVECCKKSLLECMRLHSEALSQECRKMFSRSIVVVSVQDESNLEIWDTYFDVIEEELVAQDQFGEMNRDWNIQTMAPLERAKAFAVDNWPHSEF